MEYFKAPHHEHELELVAATLDEEKGWKEAVNGASYVLHVASPVPIEQPEDPQEIIGPAVSGVENLVKAALAEPSMKRIIFTSSIAAVYAGYKQAKSDFSSADWSVLEHSVPYSQSKHHAEKKFWELINAQTDTSVQGVSINPGFVNGPVLNGTFNSSQEVIRRLMLRELPMVPDTYWGIVDVRDIATAHVNAMTAEKAPGNRYIVVSETTPFITISKILADEFGSQGYDPPTSQAPDFLLRVASLCDKSLRNFVVPNLGWNFQFDTSSTKEDLGMEAFIPAKEAILTMATSMIEHGIIPDKRPKKKEEEKENKEEAKE